MRDDQALSLMREILLADPDADVEVARVADAPHRFGYYLLLADRKISGTGDLAEVMDSLLPTANGDQRAAIHQRILAEAQLLYGNGAEPDERMRASDVRARRAALGLTQAELAARLGVTDRVVRMWETGAVTPPPYLHLALDRLAQLAAAND